ncbi:MAG: V-type ATP synthase subunit F [Candidatus Thorarchaeota archaeon]|jgi:V/A-type H+-transporting ATPase subunit F
MSSDKIAVIGDRDTVTGFRLVGVSECTVPKSPEETRKSLYHYFRDPTMGLVMITEPLAAEVEDTIVELRWKTPLLSSPNHQYQSSY